MIIKKKYTTQIKKEESSSLVEGVLEDVATEVEDFVSIENDESEELVKETRKNKVDKKKKSVEDLDLSLENIKFEQREERREGTRRRGYRRSQDRNIVSRAQKDAISIKEVAKADGYKEGIELATKDIENLKANFSEFFNYKEEVYQKVSECVLDIAVGIAKKIINKEIEVDSNYLIPMIKSVVEEVNKTENKITLKVMPKDVDIVRDNIKEIFEGNYFEAKITVVPDNSINDGGVVVETSNGLIDASIETQLAIIEKALKKQGD